MATPPHVIEMTVRDYELDLQGIVNNSVYLNYCEHARHQYMKHLGLDFSALHQEGIDAVVTRLEIDYRSSLTSGDRFQVSTSLERQGKLRLIFRQKIDRLPDRLPVIQAVVTATCLCHGRPRIPEVVEKAITAALSPS
ncbi:MAG TPA: acyl-CoA thioesterase [Spirochaetia bacterium]|nr:acyl-CoA thioesterase [Spirochaetia bacterium]